MHLPETALDLHLYDYAWWVERQTWSRFQGNNRADGFSCQ